MRRALTIALIALAASAAAAPAKDLEFRVPEAGPVIAGDRIVWVEAAFATPRVPYRIVSARPNGTLRGSKLVVTPLVPPEDYAVISIAATDRRVTVTTEAIEGNDDGPARIVASRLWSGRPWRRLTRQRGCAVFLAPALATNDAWGAGCRGRLATRDDGETLRLGVPVLPPPAPPRTMASTDMAGGFVATILPGMSEVAVFDRRSGAERYRVAPGPTGAVALDEDGSIAFALADGRVGWASIAQPSVHLLPIRGTRLRIDAGLVAAQEIPPDDPGEEAGPLTIVRLDGAPVKTVRRPGAWDVDDGRLLRTYPTGSVRTSAYTTRIP